MQLRRKLLISLALLLLTLAVAFPTSYEEGPYSKGNLLSLVVDFNPKNVAVVRVLLGRFKRVYLDGYFLEVFSGDRRRLCEGPLSVSITSRFKGIATCTDLGKVKEIPLTPETHLIAISMGPSRVSSSRRSWKTPGAILIKLDGNYLSVVNYLYLEEYLKGVVPYEMPPSWPLEALKAQAVAARTYTVKTALWRRSKGKYFDVKSTVADQVYHGMKGWKSSTNQAVDSTRGLIATYKGKPIFAFYSADCGGMTQDGELVFKNKLGGEPAPYLKPVRCIHKGRTWEVLLSPDEINLALRKITDSKVLGLSDSGPFVIVHTEKGSLKIHKAIFRKLTGYKLKSSNYHFKGSMIYGYRFKGRGLGHGVGMCQWGARDMALRGASFEEILKHYYPGIEIVHILKLFR